MVKLKRFIFTKEKVKELKEEKKSLVIEREEAVIDLSKARAMGDLSENGYYKAARQTLSTIDRRIRSVDIFLLNARIIRGSRSDIVTLGSKIIVLIEGKEREFLIVGGEEANPIEGKISNLSPMGRAFMGKKKGEKVEIKLPIGTKSFELKDIQKGV